MEGDYLKLSQFPYNFHQSPYNSYPSPLGTTGFLTFGIRAVDLEIGEYGRQEILKMVNEVLEKVKALIESHKAVSKKVKALAESNKAMNEELSRLQEVLENMTEEKLQSLDSIDQESIIHEPIAVGVNAIDPMVFDIDQTHASTNGAAHVIKNVGVDLTIMHVGGNSIEFGLCYGSHILLISGCHKAKELIASFVGDSCGINDGFHSQDVHSFYKKLSSVLLKVKFNTTTLRYVPMSWAMINCFGAVRVINGQDALAYWVNGRFPLMKVSFQNNTLWVRCFQEEGNVRNMK